MAKSQTTTQQVSTGKNTKHTIKTYSTVYGIAFVATLASPYFASSLSDALALLLLFYVVAFLSAPVMFLYHAYQFLKSKDYQMGRYHIQVAAFLLCCLLAEGLFFLYWNYKYDLLS